jgi:hypothetical protein
MKYILYPFIIAYALMCISITDVLAQDTTPNSKVPIAVYLPEENTDMPSEALTTLNNKLKAAATQSGMGATDGFAQFYLTCTSTRVDMQVIAGAPTKYRQELELSVYVVDAMSSKIFGSIDIPVHGVGNSETKAYMACFKQLSPSNSNLKNFLIKTNKGIVDYYESQIDNIITMAESLAKVYKYDEALFRLALVPEVCPSYSKIMDVATKIYQKYIDDHANRCLAKARTIWNAGQDAAAATEAGEYLAEILPEASCYEEAMALANEIKKRVKDDIEYYRNLESRDADRAHQQRMAEINAWKEVGVAYGQNQRDVYYKTLF